MASNCTALTEGQYRELVLARGINGGVCFILCVVLLLIGALASRRRRGKKSFKQWLLIYLAVVTLLHTGLFVVQIAEEFTGDEIGFCEVLGFFLEWVGWVQFSVTFLLTIHHLYLLEKTVRDCESVDCVGLPLPRHYLAPTILRQHT